MGRPVPVMFVIIEHMFVFVNSRIEHLFFFCFVFYGNESVYQPIGTIIQIRVSNKLDYVKKKKTTSMHLGADW